MFRNCVGNFYGGVYSSVSRRIPSVRACDVTAILIGERKCTGDVIGFCFGGIEE